MRMIVLSLIFEPLAALVAVGRNRHEIGAPRADGWRVEGSEYLGRTVRRTVLDASGVVSSHSDGVIRGWLDASRSDYTDDNGKPAALWHVYLATGELAGDEIDLELHEGFKMGEVYSPDDRNNVRNAPSQRQKMDLVVLP